VAQLFGRPCLVLRALARLPDPKALMRRLTWMQNVHDEMDVFSRVQMS
jgi:hypothetical protein